MEAIITIVGFLGAGKTTLLKRLVANYIERNWKPFVILNDYENAYLDAHQLSTQIEPNWLKPLSGSCICCSGIGELREQVNNIPERYRGVTLIEANGTSDACALSGFLGVGINERFLPPVQVSVVDVKNWQKRGENNELEANQIQVSSLIVLTYLEDVDEARLIEVMDSIQEFNPYAKIIKMDEINVELLPELLPSKNKAERLEHHKAHWSSCSIDMPNLPNEDAINTICNTLPGSILRVKGCAIIGNDIHYTFFEKSPDGTINIRPFNGTPVTGAKLLTIGPGSDQKVLEKAVERAL